VFRIYSFLLAIGFLVLLPVFFLRRDKYLSGIKQRLGDIPEVDRSKGDVIWLHCVSVGEVNAAKPLVEELCHRNPDKQIVVSTTTRTGQELARKILAGHVAQVFYFPFDFIFSVRRALERIKPSVVLLMETEIWFNFIREASISGAKIAIVNGRLSERSRSRYEFIQGFLLQLFPYIDLMVMQGDSDARRMIGLGMDESQVKVSGNLKFDREPAQTDSELGRSFRARFGFDADCKLILAASTHSPEEKILLESLVSLRKTIPNVRMALAPRHPERFREVVGLARASGLSCAVRSEIGKESDASADVIVVDSIGELGAVYPLAEIVFVGGSLIPHGGQNVLEPALAARAIVTGPSTHNFATVVDSLLTREAMVRIPSHISDAYPSVLAEKFAELLSDDSVREAMGRRALAVIEENRGATERTLSLLETILD
jgi:3-deoxy-D-manno-octulosonic-acid transferase